jgi:hypothetical protein
MSSGNTWSFDPFQPERKYRFRLKSTGERVEGFYKRERTKEARVSSPSEREYEFETSDGLKVFVASEIVDPQYVGI